MTALVSDLALASEAAFRSGASAAGVEISGAGVAILASTGGSRRTYWMAKTTPATATTANSGTIIRLVDVAVIILTPCRVAYSSLPYTFSSKEGTDSRARKMRFYAKLPATGAQGERPVFRPGDLSVDLARRIVYVRQLRQKIEAVSADRHRPGQIAVISPLLQASRSLNFWILPDPVNGKASTTNQCFGVLCGASEPRM